MTPISLDEALGRFDDLWSPRIVARVNDYDVRVAKVAGEHVWHAHEETDEFFLVLDGTFSVAVRDGDGEQVVHLQRGDTFVVPRGTEHRPFSTAGASILMFEPAGTSSTGDYDGAVPEHIDSTAGHAL